ncbi:MAG TPA: hypothetical protein PLW59_06315 [Sphaerochaeta sp.]|nr:hypothetical protein [Sphaerochaeta sp.]
MPSSPSGCSTETIFRYCGIGDLGLLMGKGFSLVDGKAITTWLQR